MIHGARVLPAFTFALLLSAPSAVAASPQSSTELGTPVKPDFSVTYEAEFGDDSGIQVLNHKLFAGRALWKDTLIGVSAEADQFPVDSSRRFAWKDPFLQGKAKGIFRTGKFNINGDLRLYLPVTDRSKEKNLHVGIRSGQTFSYRLGQGWQAGLKTMLRWNSFGSLATGATGGRNVSSRDDFSSFARAFGLYQTSPKLAFRLTYGASASHRLGSELLSWNNKGTSLQPGLLWDPLPSLRVEPYLALQTGEGIRLSTTTLGCDLKWEIL